MNQAQALADEIKRTAVHYASSAAVGEPTFDIAVGMEKLIDRLAAMAQPPAGWVLVPVEPTREMLDAYVNMAGRFSSARSDWAAMLAAAPSPQEPKP